jgi:hypothetical protein
LPAREVSPAGATAMMRARAASASVSSTTEQSEKREARCGGVSSTTERSEKRPGLKPKGNTVAKGGAAGVLVRRLPRRARLVSREREQQPRRRLVDDGVLGWRGRRPRGWRIPAGCKKIGKVDTFFCISWISISWTEETK